MPSFSAVWKATVRFSTILSLLRLLKSSAVGSKCAMSAQNARPSRQLVWKLVTFTVEGAHHQHALWGHMGSSGEGESKPSLKPSVLRWHQASSADVPDLTGIAAASHSCKQVPIAGF